MFQRVDKLAELGTSVVTISGGEPLLHPQLDDVDWPHPPQRHDRRPYHQRLSVGCGPHQAIEPGRLEWLQISIDNVNPDDVSKKSLKVLDKKLQTAGRARRFSCEHQLSGRRRDSESSGRAHHWQARGRTRVQFNYWHHSRWHRPLAGGRSTTKSAASTTK